jgi:CheY-like chemotaxis protein
MILVNQFRQWGIEAFAAFHVDQAIAEMIRARDLGLPYELAIVDGAEGVRSSQAWYDRLFAVGPLLGIELLPFARLGDPEPSQNTFAASAIKPLRPGLMLGTIAHVLNPSPPPECASQEPATVSNADREILLVEDNLSNQQLARRLLGELGYQVDVAANGIEAVEKVLTHTYAAVLMDCNMPLMGSIEATQLIRGREGSGSRLPIIALTPYARENERRRCMAAGMDDHVAKPIQLDDLRTVLERWVIARSPAQRSAARTTPD